MKVPFLAPDSPPLINYIFSLLKIWRRSYYTNFGPEYNQLIINLSKFLNTNNIALCSSGTLAEECILSLLKTKYKTEIITTPYTFIATSNAIIRSGLTPVFVDIDENFSLNSRQVEEAISDKTLAILTVDVYGIPNDYIKLKSIAAKHSIPIICDKSLSFGVSKNQSSLLKEADISFASLHSTKVMSSIEGGLVYAKDSAFINAIKSYTNFGIDLSSGLNLGNKMKTYRSEVMQFGTNAKIDELRCAFASILLKRIPKRIKQRKKVFDLYIQNGLDLLIPKAILRFESNCNWNYSYLPIIIDKEKRDLLYEDLLSKGVITKKYYETIIPEYEVYKKNPDSWITKGSLNNAIYLSKRIINLPIYPNINKSEIKSICQIILKHSSLDNTSIFLD